MNKKLYTQLLLAVLVSSYAVASDYTRAIGRTLNGSESFSKSGLDIAKQIPLSDAKDLKKQMNDISKNISKLSANKKDEVKAKVSSLADLVEKNKVDVKKK